VAVATLRSPAVVQRAVPSARGRAVRRLLGTPVAVIGLALVVLLVLLALTANVLPVQDPTAMDVLARRLPPGSPAHPLGTDTFGRDVLSRVTHGAQLSLLIAISVVTIGGVAGSFLGVVVGYVGGGLDSVVGRIWDAILSLPGLLLYLVVMATLGAGVPQAITAMTIGLIPGFGRLMRERVLAQRHREYVDAARVIGAGEWRIMFRHVLPNVLTPVLVQAALAIPGIMLAEASLSYLGLGVPPPAPSWGKMIAEGQSFLLIAPWLTLIPGACILLATLGFNLLGDGLRDFFDPTQRR
jgi:peptide/nickel transport system permease protein